ncbi:MAG: OsmC family protein [Armatimonadota bacterium]
MASTNGPVWMHLSADGKWEGGMRTRLQVRDFEPIYSDEPPSFGGQDSAPNPMELLLAALNGCLTVMTQVIARERGIEVHGITLHAEGELDLRGAMGDPNVPPYFRTVRERVELVTFASPEQVRALQEEVQRRCPVYTLLKAAGVEVRSEWFASSPAAEPAAR